MVAAAAGVAAAGAAAAAAEGTPASTSGPVRKSQGPVLSEALLQALWKLEPVTVEQLGQRRRVELRDRLRGYN